MRSAQGTITQGHARALLPLGDEPEQVALCRRIHEEGLSVRQTEALVQEMIEQADAEPLSLVSGDGDRAESEIGLAAAPSGQRARCRAGAGVSGRAGHPGQDHPLGPRQREAGDPLRRARGI